MPFIKWKDGSGTAQTSGGRSDDPFLAGDSFGLRQGESQMPESVGGSVTAQDDPIVGAVISVSECVICKPVITKIAISHPCAVIRRQCQVHQFARSLHITPVSLVPVIFNAVAKEGVLTFWKGAIGSSVVWCLQNVTEIVIADLIGLPRSYVVNGSTEKYWKHICLKASTFFLMTPFYVSSMIESVRSESGLSRDDNRVTDVLVKGVDRLRFSAFFFSARDASRRFGILHLALPTVFFHSSHYVLQVFLYEQFHRMAKHYLSKKPESERSRFDQFVPQLFAQMTSTLFTDLALFPIETVLHRMYIQGTRTLIDNMDTGLSAVSMTVKYSGFFDCFKSIIENEGFFALYAGVSAVVLEYGLMWGFHQLVRACFDRGSEMLRKATEGHVTPPSLSNNSSFVGPLSNTGTTGPFAPPLSPMTSPRRNMPSPPTSNRDPTQFPTFGESVSTMMQSPYGPQTSNRPNIFGEPPSLSSRNNRQALAFRSAQIEAILTESSGISDHQTTWLIIGVDDEDFEPDVEKVLPVKPPTPPPVTEAAPGKSAPAKTKGKEINMESLGRELTGAEREELQKRQDQKLAREMMGLDDISEDRPYDEIISKEEFEEFGDKIGNFIAKRHKAAHYGDLLNKLLTRISDKMDANDIRKMSNHLKAIADSKKSEPKAKPGAAKPQAAAATGKAAAKGKGKATLKSGKGADNVYDDYGDGGYGGYDNVEDDFM
ncbi:hypothetical protein WR25_16800 [Diploscapter pachys]|uniref:Uncharacterized protein n=1 Tax=Diploscapter pachys TaxID=2018661 RepID=A0A2A2K4M6_9BILA|nr:hypothetical protein WR25_16800 [Diploscapter pachys]